MAVLNPEKAPWCDQVRSILGYPSNLGWNRLGQLGLGLELDGAGIFRIDSLFGHQYQERCPFYTQWKPRTANQISWAVKFKNGMAAWHDLTPEQKDVYNNAAKRLRLHGVNLFMREWMQS
jgi:hypothetical protein